jgi:hypothetical protein
VAKAKPYVHATDPHRNFRVFVEDKRTRGTHSVIMDNLTCKVCGERYRSGTYGSHKKKPTHVARMSGHRPHPVAPKRGRRCSG